MIFGTYSMYAEKTTVDKCLLDFPEVIIIIHRYIKDPAYEVSRNVLSTKYYAV